MEPFGLLGAQRYKKSRNNAAFLKKYSGLSYPAGGFLSDGLCYPAGESRPRC